jgi:hypothetical protein
MNARVVSSIPAIGLGAVLFWLVPAHTSAQTKPGIDNN